MNTIIDLTIIGAGPAGYTAALYAGRARIAPLMFTGAPTEASPDRMPGGQLMTTTDVENFPGLEQPLPGPELVRRMEGQAARAGARVVQENVVALDLSQHPFRIRTETTSLESRAIILATGASPRALGVPGETRYRNRGVAFCATCDGALFAGADVLVVGGGDSALTEVSYLSRLVRSVTLVHRRERLRASPVLQERVTRLSNVRLMYETVVTKVIGDGERMTGVGLRHLRSGDEQTLDARGLFLSIGHVPATALVAGQVELDGEGYVRTLPGSTHTNVGGLFACGDVQDHVYRQAVTAAASGAMAAIDAQRWLNERV